MTASEPAPTRIRARLARLRRPAAGALGAALLGVVACDLAVEIGARDRVQSDLASLSPAPVALVLGTAKLHHGRPNPFYDARLDAAAELFHAGKVRGILVSGDNGTADYDEPTEMRDDLVARGIPAQYVTRDHAGFRTLDSVVRAREVFGQDRVIIVSQRFHASRAAFLAARYGIDATGYAARDPGTAAYVKVRLREVAARTLAVFDVVVGRSPRFLGEPVPVALAE